jgi:hypothetical protein
MRNILLVAKREYLEQIRGRAFRMTTILVPAALRSHHGRRLSLQHRPRFQQARRHRSR